MRRMGRDKWTTHGVNAKAWLSSRRVVFAGCGLAATLPLVAVLVALGRNGWTPQGDDAALSWRAWLVFSRRPPTVGPYTLASVQGGPAYNPGPLLFWVMAVPVRLFPGIGPVLGVVVLGITSAGAG